ncbi:MAG: hypothetical protein NG740_04335 [Omnitrophica bacterium]|nr:hypothetical protein [Candidatus Omnitrophota bacterium]
MRPSYHAIISFSLGALLWFFTKSVYAGILCFLSGWLIDFDHVIEYALQYGFKNFKFKTIYQTCKLVLFDRLYLIFHAYEIMIILWVATIATKNIYLLGISIGYSSHLIMDVITNPVLPFSYFITRRFLKQFKIHELMKESFIPRLKKK